MKKEKKKNQSETLKKVLRYIKRYRWYLILSLFFAVITVAATLYIPVLTGDAIDYIIDKGLVNFSAVFAILIKIGVVIGVTALAQWLMNVCNNKITYEVIQVFLNLVIHCKQFQYSLYESILFRLVI